MLETGGERLGDGQPDLVGSLDPWLRVDSLDGALDTGNDTGSNVKLLIRRCCMWLFRRPNERLRISSCACGLSC